MGYKEHKAGAPKAVRCYVLTVSDTRTKTTDESGQAVIRLLRKRGHAVAGYAILKDEPREIRRLLRRESLRADVQAFIVTGGTGISRRDSTFDAIDGLLEKRLPGFGELFRMLSYHEIGSAAVMSRATSGVFRGKIVISTPGALDAVRLAMEKLILPELPHMVGELARG